jgi:hypothetical protein
MTQISDAVAKLQELTAAIVADVQAKDAHITDLEAQLATAVATPPEDQSVANDLDLAITALETIAPPPPPVEVVVPTYYNFIGDPASVIDNNVWPKADVVGLNGETLYTLADSTVVPDPTLWVVYTGVTSPAVAAS